MSVQQIASPKGMVQHLMPQLIPHLLNMHGGLSPNLPNRWGKWSLEQYLFFEDRLLTPILLWAHIHRKVLILGSVSIFQIQLAEKGVLSSNPIASLYALLNSKMPWGELAQISSSEPLLVIEVGVAWQTCNNSKSWENSCNLMG